MLRRARVGHADPPWPRGRLAHQTPRTPGTNRSIFRWFRSWFRTFGRTSFR